MRLNLLWKAFLVVCTIAIVTITNVTSVNAEDYYMDLDGEEQITEEVTEVQVEALEDVAVWSFDCRSEESQVTGDMTTDKSAGYNKLQFNTPYLCEVVNASPETDSLPLRVRIK